eukprot:336418_1
MSQPASLVSSTMKHVFISIDTYSLELTVAAIVIVVLVLFKEALKEDPEKITPPYKTFERSTSNIPNSSHHAPNPPSIKPALLANQVNDASNAVQPPMPLAPITESTDVAQPKPHVLSKPVIPRPKPMIKPRNERIQRCKPSKVFYSHRKPSVNPNKDQMLATKNAGKVGVLSPTEHVKQLQNELDMTCYPEYLDGYNSLSVDQKKLLSAIKDGNLSLVKYMANNITEIVNDIKFGECQVLRECVLSNQLEILKYLKGKFVNDVDLNGESGYILRWASRKGLMEMVKYLLCEQKYEKIDISFFQYQAIEWAIVYRHKEIAKILQKYYRDYKLSTKWNVLQNAEPQQDLGVEFDIFNLPSIYQNIIEMIVNCDNEATSKQYVDTIEAYMDNGCDMKFENNMAWIVASDCANLAVLTFLHEHVGIDAVCCDNYLLRTSLESNNIELLRFAKTIINWQNWKQKVEPHINRLKLLCSHSQSDNEMLIKELENYHTIDAITTPEKNKRNGSKQATQPQTPIPWPYEQAHVRSKYGILTRSKRKMLVKKGILQDYK